MLLLFNLFSKLYKTSANGCFLVYSSNFIRIEFDFYILTNTFYLNFSFASSEPMRF